MNDDFELPKPVIPQEIEYPTPLVAKIVENEPESSKKYRRFFGFLKDEITPDELIADRIAQANVHIIIADKEPQGADTEFNNPFPHLAWDSETGEEKLLAPPFMLKGDENHMYYTDLFGSYNENSRFLREGDKVETSEYVAGPKFPKRRVGVPIPYTGTLHRVSVEGGKAESYNYNTGNWEIDDSEITYKSIDKEKLTEAIGLVEEAKREGASDNEFDYKMAEDALLYKYDINEGTCEVPPISEMLNRLSEVERKNLLKLSTFKSLVQRYFDEQVSPDNNVLFRFNMDRKNFSSSDTSVNAAGDLGFCTWAGSHGFILTVPELRMLLSQDVMQPEDFIDSFPQEARGLHGEILPEEVLKFRQFIAENYQNEVDSNINTKPLSDIIKEDYIFSANAQVNALYTLQPETGVLHYKMFVNKARALAEAADYQLDETDITESLRNLFTGVLKYNLDEADKKIVEGGPFVTPLSIFSDNIAGVLDMALFVGEDIEFAKPYFAEAYPAMFKSIAKSWEKVKTGISIPESYKEYKNRLLRWATALGRNDFADRIAEIEREGGGE